jgi:hypothetical protein
MLGWEVQANQKRPTTRMTPPTIIGGRRSSGMTFFALVNLGVKITLVSHVRVAHAMSTPIKIAINGSDAIPVSIWRSSWKLYGYAKKIRYKMPYTKLM